jgi:translation initiation factor IF-2
MAELKLPRLLAAAKEFNIGQDTLIDFLIGKGFGKDDLKPTSKLTEDMYRSLQNEFSSDKAAKNQE